MPPIDYLIARKGTAEEWAEKNPSPVLKLGELGVETDTHRMKIGDGVTPWSSLPYLTCPIDGESVTIQVNRGTAAELAASNSVLPAGVIVLEEDTRKTKFGDGSTPWNSLPYSTCPVDGVEVPLKINRDTDANLVLNDPVVPSGELLLNLTTGRLTCGDGTSKHSELPVIGKQLPTVITVSKGGKVGYADFRCSDAVYGGDDAACIQAAINYCATNGIKTIYVFEGIYTFSTPITGSSDLTIYGYGNVTLYSNSLSSDMISLAGTLIKTVTGSDVSIGDTSITVSDATNVSPGDLIIIYDNTIWETTASAPYNTVKTGEIHEVSSVSGNVIYFVDRLLHGYSAANGLNVKVIAPIAITIENINFLGASITDTNGLLSLKYIKNCTLSKCNVDKGGKRGILITDSYFVSVHNCKIINCNNPDNGYGIIISNACAHIFIYSNKIDNCRHCVASGGDYTIGQPRDINVFSNDLFTGVSHAIDAHPCVESINAYNNNIYNLPDHYSMVSGARHSKFTNNVVYGGFGAAIRGDTKNVIYRVESNMFYSSGYAFDTYSATCTQLDVSVIYNQMFNSTLYLVHILNASAVNILGNSIDQTTSYYGIYLTNVTGGSVLNNSVANTYRSGVYLTSCQNLKISNNTIKNSNRYNNDGQLYESGIALVDCTNVELYNNTVPDSTGYQRYAIKEYGTSDSNIIKNNNVSGAKTAQISKSGASTKITQNEGYKTENTGTATITATNTSVTVTHGLATTPTKVIVTPGGNINCWVDPASITATQFILSCTAPAADTVVYWSAVV